MKYILITLALLATQLNAETITFKFEPPTQREDDTQLTQDEINKYFLFINDKWAIDIKKNETNTFSYDLSPGEHIITMETEDTGGRVSKRSNSFYVTVKEPSTISPPLAPGNVQVTVRVNVQAPQ